VTQTQLDHEVADITGESVLRVHRPGDSVPPEGPADAEPETLYLVINCPHCRRPALYPGQLPDGSSPLAECPGCEALFDYDIQDVSVTASRPGARTPAS
jgi:hypothetical protein